MVRNQKIFKEIKFKAEDSFLENEQSNLKFFTCVNVRGKHIDLLYQLI